MMSAETNTQTLSEAQTLKAAMTAICEDAVSISLTAASLDTLAECGRLLADSCEQLVPDDRAIINRVCHLLDLTVVQSKSLIVAAERIELSSRSWVVRYA